MKYILIIWMLASGSGGGSIITNAAYENKGVCESAGVATQVAMQRDSRYATIGFTCTRQAEQ